MPRIPPVILFAAVLSASGVGAAEVNATVDAAHPGMAVAKSFAGISHEWGPFAKPDGGSVAQVHPVYLRLLEHLVAFNDAALKLTAPFSAASVKRLEAGSIEATRGISFAGRTFDNSADGNPIGARMEEKIPVAESGVHFHVAPASAVLLTVKP